MRRVAESARLQSPCTCIAMPLVPKAQCWPLPFRAIGTSAADDRAETPLTTLLDEHSEIIYWKGRNLDLANISNKYDVDEVPMALLVSECSLVK